MCKRSSTRSKGLLSTVPFSVRYLTDFVPVNRRFRLEPVLVSNRAVPSLLTCKRAFNRGSLKEEKGGKVWKGKRRAERSSDDERHESNYDSGEYRK